MVINGHKTAADTDSQMAALVRRAFSEVRTVLMLLAEHGKWQPRVHDNSPRTEALVDNWRPYTQHATMSVH